MKLQIIFALLALQLIEAKPAHNFDEELLESEWMEFKNKYNKNYKDEEEHLYRRKIYFENRDLISKHNALANKATLVEKPSFELGLNKYSDLSNDEFKAMMNGLKPSLRRSANSTFRLNSSESVEAQVDWRTKGYVSEVKDQGACGSCWAFSATGALESQIYKKNNKKVSLSEQNLIDCSAKYGNEGCNGGMMDNAFQYIKENHGIDTEKSYPYEGLNSKCRYNSKNKGGDDTGFVDLPENDEEALLNALATIGPVSVGIDASSPQFQLYKTGIYDDESCSEENLDHGVLVVGYGPGYWIVKNSWGTSWGDEGYIKMARGKNQCGIAKMASYPLV